MIIEVSYVPEGSKEVVTERFKLASKYSVFYVNGCLSDRPCLSFFAESFVDGCAKSVYHEIFAESIVFNIIDF